LIIPQKIEIPIPINIGILDYLLPVGGLATLGEFMFDF